MVANLHKTQISKEDYDFWSKFLEIYKSCEYLWSNKPELRFDKEKYRVERQEGFLRLVKWCRTRYPRIDVDEIKKHLQIFKTNFKKHHNKVISCHKHGLKFSPLIWYYDILSFLVNEDDIIRYPDHSEANDYKQHGNFVNNTIDIKPAPETKRAKLSICPITDQNIEQNIYKYPDAIHSNENIADIEKPIKIEIDETIFTSNNEINFTENEITDNKELFTNNKNNANTNLLTTDNTQISSTSSISIEQSNIKCSSRSPSVFFSPSKKNEIYTKKNKSKTSKITSKDFYNLNCKTLDSILQLSTSEDSFDITGRKYASDLREIKTEEQRLLVEKIMNEVIYYAKNNLLANTYFFEPNIKKFVKPENGYQQK